MTSLLSAPTRPVASDVRHRRPLVLLATLGGVAAAAAPLLVCLALGVAGWFLADAGSHGAPRDGLQVGALAWLMAHGSGVRVQGAAVTVVPLGLTLLCGWGVWRLGHRLGDSISGHGPDADRIADGERDWTVPSATALFAMGYVAVVVLTSSVAGTAQTAPSVVRASFWAVLLTVVVGGPAIAIGSGRLPIWSASWPVTLKASVSAAARILGGFLLVALVAFVIALVLDLASAANVLSQLDTDGADTSIFVVTSLAVVPNATVFSGAYLLGPGFAVGASTLVSPTAVILGPLPLFPMLAALPDAGQPAAWTAYLMAIPVLGAAYASARALRRFPSVRWEEGAVRGCAGGLLAGVGFALLCAVAGGSVGPGRMRVVGPFSGDVLVHAVTALGIGGLLGGLVITWWHRRQARAQLG